MLGDIVIRANPDYPPCSLPVICKLALDCKKSLVSTVHIHSNVKLSDETRRVKLLEFIPRMTISIRPSCRITLIWSYDENKDVSLSAGKMLLKGEVNLAKYLCSLLGLLPNRNATLDDARLDDVHKSVIWNDDSKIILSNIQQLCSVQGFLGGKEFGLSDLVACSKVRQVSNCSTLITQWLERCDQYLRGSHPKALKKQEDSDPKNRLLQYLKDNEIAFENIEHPEVFTVEAMMPYLTNVKGAVAKNLFLKDKKGGLFLLSALHNRNINLTTIAKTVKAPGLRFASEDLLIEVLGVKQGCVTAFALINDTEKRVKFLADEELVNGNYTTVFFHPLVNTATTGVSCDDFKKFVCLTGHDIRTIQI